jgi:hypothetical protein
VGAASRGLSALPSLVNNNIPHLSTPYPWQATHILIITKKKASAAAAVPGLEGVLVLLLLPPLCPDLQRRWWC